MLLSTKKIQLAIVSVFILQTIFSSCQKNISDVQPSTLDSSEVEMKVLQSMSANFYNDLFTRYGNGWTGGDATYSVPLPDGRVVWMFGDTFLDTVYADRSRPYSGLIRNSFVIQDGSTMTTLYGGTKNAPVSFIDTGDPDQWYWPLDGTVQNNILYVYFALFEKTGNGAFDFAYLKTDLMQFSLPAVSLVSTTTVSSSTAIHYGSCVYEDGGYLYIFGDEKFSFTEYAHVARVALANLYGTWDYWNGIAWVTTLPAVTLGRMKKGIKNIDVSQQFSVFYADGKYRFVTQQNLFGKKIFTYEAAAITGPWYLKNTVYLTPETAGNIWTYNAFVHPEFDSAGYHLLSYNVNSFDFNDLFVNADNYRPKFIWYKY
ncbi:MAG: DUF5005 domain-containing protein [Chitinophagales bacterium]|nr:DUF5005 domain-containing protein [Chitinophagales bacterium]